MAQWTERRPGNQRVAGLIPSQGTGLGCGPGSQLEACDRQPVVLSLHPSPRGEKKGSCFDQSSLTSKRAHQEGVRKEGHGIAVQNSATLQLLWPRGSFPDALTWRCPREQELGVKHRGHGVLYPVTGRVICRTLVATNHTALTQLSLLVLSFHLRALQFI